MMVPDRAVDSNDRGQADTDGAASGPRCRGRSTAGDVVWPGRAPYGSDVRTTGLGPAPLRRRLTPLLLVVVLAAGCGSSELDPDAGSVGDGPRVAHPRFDGDFEVVAISVDGRAVEVDQRPTVQIEAEFGGLTVLPGCNTYFGSFTLAEDGTASFTVTGGTELDCGDLADQEEAVLAALAGATSWVEVDGGFRFDGPGTEVAVRGPTG